MVGIKVWTYNLMTLRMCRFVSANSSYYNFKLLMFPCLIAKKEDVAKLTPKNKVNNTDKTVNNKKCILLKY